MFTELSNRKIREMVAATCLLFLTLPAFSQVPPRPQTHELLNGLKILFWPKPGSTQLLVKLRINSGSAFDLDGKSGEMALLGDLLFPEPTTVDYFTEQMDGKLEVTVNYDSITITMLGKPDEFDNIIDVLKNAILVTPISPETVAKVREIRLKSIQDQSVSPALVADRAIAVRLFGNFPYGQPSGGSAEEVARIQRGDLMLARERFLNSNNATLAIIGDIPQNRLVRSLKQHFGPWHKSDELVPSTFRTPNPPDPKILIVNVPSPTAEIRLAVRGVSRSDKDYYTAKILARLVQNQLPASAPKLADATIYARSESHTLPGGFIIGVTTKAEFTADAVASVKQLFESLITTTVSALDLERAKREVVAEHESQTRKLENEPDPWLDSYTYRLGDIQDQTASYRGVTSLDVQRVATRLFKGTSVATVVVGESLLLKPTLQGRFEFEILGEVPEKTSAPGPPGKPETLSSPS